MGYVVGFGELCFFCMAAPRKIQVLYIPFTGCMFLDFLVIALLDQSHGAPGIIIVLYFRARGFLLHSVAFVSYLFK